MSIPKTAVLTELQSSGRGSRPPVALAGDAAVNSKIVIRPVSCLNDFVAILMFRMETSIAMPDESSSYKNEGIVIGIGPGIPDNAGGRVASQLNIGDVVIFNHKNIVMEVESDSPPYNGQRVVIISERSLICKSRPVEFSVEH